MLISSYEQSENPPAPYVDLQVSPSRRLYLREDYRGKLDSGAAITVIPIQLVRQWRLRSGGDIHVRAFDGTFIVRPFYTVDVFIGTQRFSRMRVLASRRANVLLGRDILNQLTITYNGPHLRVEIHDA